MAHRLVITLFAGIASAAAWGAAEAQSLGSGDYELCSVYRPDGSFAGYSHACLERQRAAIRRNSQRHSGHYTPPAPAAGSSFAGYGAVTSLCPSWANNGYGFSSTMRSTGFGSTIQYGTFNSTVNGQPCTPNPVIFRRGVN
ncbi:hypothetical protein [Glycocaulis sp.]